MPQGGALGTCAIRLLKVRCRCSVELNAETALFLQRPIQNSNEKCYEQYPNIYFQRVTLTTGSLKHPHLEHHVGDEVCRTLRDGGRCLEIVISYEL